MSYRRRKSRASGRRGRAFRLAEPLRQKGALHGVGRQVESAAIGGGRLLASVGASQEVGPRRVEVLVGVEALDEVDQLEATLGPLAHRGGDCSVQLDHR